MNVYVGLPFHDIILLPKLPKSAGLPVGTTQQVKQRLVSGRLYVHTYTSFHAYGHTRFFHAI